MGPVVITAIAILNVSSGMSATTNPALEAASRKPVILVSI